MHKIYEKKLLMLKPDELIIRHGKFGSETDSESLKALARSIAANGIIQPLSVRKNENGKYELIAGKRRLNAAVIAGLRRVPCAVHKVDDCTAELFSLIENMQRSSLSFFDEARAEEQIMLRYGLSVSETAARLGISEFSLSDKLGILRLDGEIVEKIISAGLSAEYAVLLLKLPPEKRKNALDVILSEHMTPQKAPQRIAESENQREEKPKTEAAALAEKPCRKGAIGDVRLFSNSLTKLVEALQGSGLSAYSKKYETEKYIEYRVRIKKSSSVAQTATQLKIC